jgi:hypothetical protein
VNVKSIAMAKELGRVPAKSMRLGTNGIGLAYPRLDRRSRNGVAFHHPDHAPREPPGGAGDRQKPEASETARYFAALSPALAVCVPRAPDGSNPLAHHHVELARPSTVLIAEPAVLKTLGVGGRGPCQPGFLKTQQVVGHRGPTDLTTAGNGAVRLTAAELQPQDFSDFARG